MKKLVFALLLLLTACLPQANVVIHSERDVNIHAEIAKTLPQWTRGLMERKSLAQNDGMLFIFPEQKEKAFWMKNTLIPLDIIFISADKKIVGYATAHPCLKEPCEIYASKVPVLYVLEVNAGFVEKNRIKLNDSIELNY